MLKVSLFLSIILLFVLGLGVLYTQDPGHLSFQWQSWTFEYSLWLVSVISITGFWVLYFALMIPQKLKTWWMLRTYRKKNSQLETENNIFKFEQKILLSVIHRDWVQLYYALKNTDLTLQKKTNQAILVHSYQQLFQNNPPILTTELSHLENQLPRTIRKQLAAERAQE